MHFHHLANSAKKNPVLKLGASSWTVLTTETRKKYPVEDPAVVPVTRGRRKVKPLDEEIEKWGMDRWWPGAPRCFHCLLHMHSKHVGLNFIVWIKLSSQRLKLMNFCWSKSECAVVGLMVKVFNADPGEQIGKIMVTQLLSLFPLYTDYFRFPL